ncbi:MAG TPA: ubiquitin-activating E1 FCCH domain-containing protein [Nitrososphaeraceae archaeon]
MAEYSRLAKGRFTSTGAAQIINLPFQPDWVEFINYTASASGADNGVPHAYWDANMGQGVAVVERFQAANQLTTDTVDTLGITTFSAGQLLQYGAAQAVSTITKANPAVVTMTAAHGLTSGDVVIFNNLYQTATTGMQQIAGIPFTVTVTGATTFTIPWNTNQSNYTAYDTATSTEDASMKKVLYPYLYFPGDNFISAITTGTTTTIDTTTAHNFVVGQEVAFRVPTAWGTQQLNSLPNVTTPGSPIYAYVIAVTDYNTFVVNVNSTNYTAFDSNQTFTGFVGQSFAQVVAVGDVNTGGVQISSGSALYPPPYSVPIGTTRVNTINGPAIMGAYVNNTAQGFVIGAGTAQGDSSAILIGAAEDVIYWRAYLHDYSSP